MSQNTLDPHDPSDVKDYAINWAALLIGDGEAAISSSTWGASVPTGLTISSTTATATLAVVWVTGGEPGRTYGLTNKITTPLGRTHERTIFVPCKQL
jgi:hypothetical protein